ncbi:hypothetical protein [Helicobacter sp. UBA3407]|uniref:hypothetical protein n=1 Tax=Helicobacter TaxID=209 RepID=UPI00262B9438|nr:hypothetical protein [Helicobacter sp. UBA3407]
MLTFDSFASCKPQHYQNLSPNLKIEKSPNVLVNKNTMDWILQTLLFHSPSIHNANLTISSTFSHSKSQESSLSEENILLEIFKFSQFYRRIQRINHSKFLMEQSEFLRQIERKIKHYAYLSITQQEAQEAQDSIYLQMNKQMLQLHKENPKLLKETMDKVYQFYTKKESFNNPLFLDSNESRIIEILSEYGIQAESKDLENLFINYLSTLPKIIKDSTKNGEIETKCLKEIEQNINAFRIHQVELIGFGFFVPLVEKFSQKEQETIADSIAKVLSFYLQPNSMEKGGYKISWQPPQPNILDYDLLPSLLKSTENAEIKIEFQVLIVFPTRFQNKFKS